MCRAKISPISALMLLLFSCPAAVPQSLVPDPTVGAQVGNAPIGGWRQTDAKGNPIQPQWTVSQAADGSLCVVTKTRLEGDSYLFHTFETGGPFEVHFELLTGPSASQRGLGFGLSRGNPGSIGGRSLYMAVLGNGYIGQNDGAFWRLLAPYKANTWYQIGLLIDPGIGGAWFYLDGRLVFETPLALSTSIHEDAESRANRQNSFAFYFNNGGGTGETIVVRNVHVSQADVPSAPRDVAAEALDGRVRISWRPAPEASTAAYRIYKAGTAAAQVPASTFQWDDRDVQPGRAYAYTVRAVDGAGRESISSWPAAVVVPVKPPSSPAWAVSGGAFDLVVYGGTPGGVAAAVAAARRGSRVALVSPTNRISGMMGGGLGITDIRYRRSASGIFKEMVTRMLAMYREAYGPNSRQVRDCSDGFWFEPRMADALLENMLAETPGVAVYRNCVLQDVETVPLWRFAGASRRVTAVTARRPDGSIVRFTAGVFVDATYEGDLAAAAGAPYRVGREPRSEFGEEYAGVVYWDWNTMELLPSSTGEGDRRVQAYNYRFTLTNRPGNRVPIPKPPSYERYLPIYQNIARDVREGKISRISQVIYFGPLPNDKYDINNMGRYWPSTDHIEENYDYPEAPPERRAQIAQDHKEYILGLMYYLQNDPELPEDFRRDALQWGLPKDEHTESGHFPEQLYVREARRIEGRYIFREQDARRTEKTPRAPVHFDSIAVADYPLDSHATRKREPEHPEALEGFFYQPRITVPSQVPMRILVPKDLDGILVCCAVSATHVGYGTLRLEPVYMAMGEACGVIADLVRRRWIPTSLMPALPVQVDLTNKGALLTYFHDLEATQPAFAAFQLLGAKGFFEDYTARPADPADKTTAEEWLVKLFPQAAYKNRQLGAASEEGPLTHGELRTWLSSIKETALRPVSAGSWVPSSAKPDSALVSRADLCSVLWRMIP
ncbi:MAG: FAD-dependent oxidoreductase [Armatimonadota bacterium]